MIASEQKQRTLGVLARRGGFTLIELLVVMAIVVVMTAITIPAMTQFLKGRKLDDSGRIIQSAFNEARRAAITTRKDHFLIIFREAVAGAVGATVFKFRLFKDESGYDEKSSFALPQGIQLVLKDGANLNAAPGQKLGSLDGCEIAVFQTEIPNAQNNSVLFSVPDTKLNTDAPGIGWVTFHRDGTVEFLTPARDQNTPLINGRSIYDLNEIFDESEVGPNLLADIKLVQDGETSKMCYVDVTPNTGRVSFRVVNTGGGVPGTVVGP